MIKKVKAIIVDDQQIFRKGFITLLEPEGIEFIAEAENGIELFHLLDDKKLMPDVVLLDLDMPEMDGNKTLLKIRQKYADLKVIIISTYNEGSLMNDFIAKGANAYLTKNTALAIVIETIKRVHSLSGYSNISAKVDSKFTEAEVRVIPLLLAGNTSKRIAEILGISSKAVEGCRNRLYEKTGTTNAAEFSNYCGKVGLEFLGVKSHSKIN